MKPVITIDTEEDNWGEFSHCQTLENIGKIPRLQNCLMMDVNPPFITHSVATDDKCAL
jgi:hypothetical protein